MAKIDLFNLPKTTFVRSLKGQKIMIYGNNGLGKTKQSMNFKKPLLLMTESGGNAFAQKKYAIDSWSTFTGVVRELTGKNKDKLQEMYETIIIDTLDALVLLNESAVANEYGVREIGEMNSVQGAPNGYKYSRNRFTMFINLLTLAGYCVVFLCHEEITDVPLGNGKTTPKYVPYGTGNRKSSNAFVKDLCDFVIRVEGNGTDGNGIPVLSSALMIENNTAFARSRFTHIIPYLETFTAENVEKAILDAIEAEAKDQGADITDEFVPQAEDKAQSKQEIIEMIEPLVKTLYKIDSDGVTNIIENQLGKGAKVSEATENQLTELHAIYDALNDIAIARNITIE